MNFDDFQTLWQTQPLPSPPDAAAIEATLKRVRADARAFERTLLWRDLREVVAALTVCLFFAWEARTRMLAGTPSWHAWLAATLPLGVAIFLVTDRLRARRASPSDAPSVVAEIDRALATLRHQHWLLTHVTWWYLLPLGASALLFIVQPIADASPLWPVRLALGACMTAFLATVHAAIWWINRRAATKTLAPRINQLERERHAFFDPVTTTTPPDLP